MQNTNQIDSSTEAAEAAEGNANGASLFFKTAADVKARTIFPSVQDAVTVAMQILRFPEYTGLPLSVVGSTRGEDGGLEIDDTVYSDGTQAALHVLGVKGQSDTAIVIYPIPSVEQILGHEMATDFLSSVLTTELSLRALRGTRDVLADTDDRGKRVSRVPSQAELDAAVARMPRTVADYLTPKTGTSGGMGTLYAAYTAAYKSILDILQRICTKERIPAHFNKTLVRQALASVEFADTYYPAVEGLGAFERILDALIAGGQKNDQDVQIFQTWKATRATMPAEAAPVKGGKAAEDVDLDNLEIDFS